MWCARSTYSHSHIKCSAQSGFRCSAARARIHQRHSTDLLLAIPQSSVYGSLCFCRRDTCANRLSAPFVAIRQCVVISAQDDKHRWLQSDKYAAPISGRCAVVRDPMGGHRECECSRDGFRWSAYRYDNTRYAAAYGVNGVHKANASKLVFPTSCMTRRSEMLPSFFRYEARRRIALRCVGGLFCSSAFATLNHSCVCAFLQRLPVTMTKSSSAICLPGRSTGLCADRLPSRIWIRRCARTLFTRSPDWTLSGTPSNRWVCMTLEKRALTALLWFHMYSFFYYSNEPEWNGCVCVCVCVCILYIAI